MNKEAIEKKLVEFEELAKEVKATKKGLKALEPLEEEIGKLLRECLRESKHDEDFDFVADATYRIIEAKKSLYN